jgi:glutathione S-transferase
MKLHIAPPSPRAIKVVALKNNLGLDCEIRVLNFSTGDHTTPEFAALNPNQLMPVLEDDGFVLWESNAILQYLAAKKPERSLWPSDPQRQADVLRWMSWEGAHWAPDGCSILIRENLLKRIFGGGDPDPAEIARGQSEFHRFGGVLDGCLKGRKWLTGNDLTIADYSVGAWMAVAQLAQYPLAKYTEINRWYAALSSQPGWKEAIVPPPLAH